MEKKIRLELSRTTLCYHLEAEDGVICGQGVPGVYDMNENDI